MPDTLSLEDEFPQDEDVVYLNHAGVAPWPARTARAVSEFAGENVRSGGRNRRDWLVREETLRRQCCELINVTDTKDMALLKNTSEGLSVVASGLDWREGDNVVTSDEEFPSNRIPWLAQSDRGVSLREVSLAGEDPEAALLDACDRDTRVLTISSVQYASGLRLDLTRLGESCRERGIIFCVDAIQSLGAHRFDAAAAQADCVAADAHKWMLGPEGIALFWCRPDLRERLRLHQFGWHMVRDAGDFSSRDITPAASAQRFECGSPNMLGIYGMSASLSLLEEAGMGNVEAGIRDNIDYLIENLKRIDGVGILSRHRPDFPAGIMVFHVKGRDSGELHADLLNKGIICAARGGGIRFSPHFYTPRDRLDRAIEAVSECCKSP